MAQHEKKMIPGMAYGVRGAGSSTISHGAPGTSKDVRKGIWSALLAPAVVLCLFFFCSTSWAVCQPYSSYFSGQTNNSCSVATVSRVTCSGYTSCHSNGNDCRFYSSTTNLGCFSGNIVGFWSDCVVCTTQAESDSVECETSGLIWSDGHCQAPIDSTVCDEDKAACEEEYGGVWTGSAQADGTCISHCDLCGTGTQNRLRNQWINACCSQTNPQGQPVAPPAEIDGCAQELSVGSGMDFSIFTCGGAVGDCDVCRDLDYDDTAPADYIKYCQNGQRYDENAGNSSSSQDSSGHAPSDTTGEGEGDFEYDYYGILDTIRDTLIHPINKNLEFIASCLATKTCVSTGDTVIVDVSMVGDSIKMANDTTRKWLKRIADSIGVSTDSLISHLDSIKDNIPSDILDSILKYEKDDSEGFDSLYERMGKGFHGVDSLIDSVLYWLGQGSAPFESTLSVLGDSIGSVNGAIGGIGDRLDSMWNSDGTNVSGWGDTLYDGYVNGSDTSGNGYLGELGSVVDSMGSDSVYGHIFRHDTARGIDSSLFALPNIDSAKVALQASIDSDYAELEGQMQTYFDTLRDEIQLINFDSAIIAPLSDKVPNTNTCPADCFAIDMSGAGAAFSEVKGLSWPLCKSWSALGGMNVLLFLRVILRIICAITCVYIGVWFIAGKR